MACQAGTLADRRDRPKCTLLLVFHIVALTAQGAQEVGSWQGAGLRVRQAGWGKACTDTICLSPRQAAPRHQHAFCPG